jgi:hypothetical protein
MTKFEVQNCYTISFRLWKEGLKETALTNNTSSKITSALKGKTRDPDEEKQRLNLMWESDWKISNQEHDNKTISPNLRQNSHIWEPKTTWNIIHISNSLLFLSFLSQSMKAYNNWSAPSWNKAVIKQQNRSNPKFNIIKNVLKQKTTVHWRQSWTWN